MKAEPPPVPTPRASASEIAARARRELADTILPFWERTIDEVNGGVFNCWSNDGTRLGCRDKFTWSQGRFAWLAARVSEMSRRGRVPRDAQVWLGHAERTVQFLQRHAFLDDGRCAFLLSETGAVKEAIPGQGPAPSIYADCFVVMGLAEFARVSGRPAPLEQAWRLLGHIEARLAAGRVPTHPEPVPEGYVSHALAMIHLNLTLVVHEACVALGDPRAATARARRKAAAAVIFDRFLLPEGRIQEQKPLRTEDADTLLSRHMNPGHALEGLWMLLTVAAEEKRDDWLARAAAAVRFQFERGWDEPHGGLLHYVDADGGPPAGRMGSSAYEAGVRATWDTKLWWVHSEAIYASALGWQLTGDDRLRQWFERGWDYSLRVFPHPDPQVGEWIQIRDRAGRPLDRVVALPVKDPYHIVRNLLQVIELFSGDATLSRA